MVTLREYSDKISSMWVYEENGKDTPDTVSYGSTKEFTWKCNNNPKHVFRKKVLQMFNNKTGKPVGCIYCEAERPLPFPGETDLFSILPIAKKMWDYDTNVGFDTNCIHPGTPTKAWFKCENGHSFQRDICRFVKNQDCPICRELKNVIAKFPHMVKQWHFEKNTDIDINLTSATSKQEAWWKCKKCGYEWQAQISSRRASKGQCPCCEVRIVVQEGATDLFTLHPSLKEEYDFEENKDIDITQLSITSRNLVWWQCKKAGHKWKVSPNSRIRSSNGTQTISECPYCKGIKRYISYAEEYPDLLAMFLERRNGIAFEKITSAQIKQKFWWHCNACENDFESTLGSMLRSRNSAAKGCSYCAGKKVVKEQSFAFLHPEVMDEYDPANIVDPYNVVEGSLIKVSWICRNNPAHKWQTTFRQRSGGRGKCPECRGWHYSKMLWQERPDLEKYYDIQKNKRPFNSYSNKSNDKVWWLCEEGHSFKRFIFHAVTAVSFECPVCTNKLLTDGVNDLASQFPELAAEFDSVRNHITPNKVIQNSITEYWWRCKEGHTFIRAPYYRTTGFSECPVCARTLIVKDINDFQTAYPKIVNIWDYEKNDLRPDEISDRNTGKFAFRCKKGHTYDSYLSTAIFNNFDCLICNKVLIQPGVNSLLDTHPALAAEFSPNEVRNPSNFTKDMAYFILWRCPVCQGDYSCRIRDRELNDKSCPYCNKKRALIGYNSLINTHPDLVKEWSPNNERGPETFVKEVKTYVKWICSNCNGEYSASIAEREVGDNSCPYCNDNKPLPGYNTLADTHPELTEEWSENNDKTPYEVTKEYSYPVQWRCLVCHGEFTSKIKEREIGDDACPYCNRNRTLLGFNSLIDTHPELAKEWSPANRRSADTYVKATKKYVKWVCPTCNGEYPAKISEREVGDDSCPYCNNKQVLIGYNSLLDTHIALTLEWGKSNEYGPEKYYKNSTSYVSWVCPKCHGEYKARIRDREIGDNLCPYCRNIKPLRDYNTLQIKQPDLLSEWDFVNNYLLCDPNNILTNYSHKVWWKCKNNNHKYLMSPQQKMYYKKRNWISCPHCKGLRNKKIYII